MAVTGGASGIGAATVTRFRAGGDSVVSLDRARPLETNMTLPAITVDLTAPADALRAVDQAASSLGGLDVLVCCAGVDHRGTLEETSVDDWDRVHAVNLRAVFLCARAAIPHFRSAGGGAIVIVASQLAYVVQQSAAAYCASKAGAVQLARAISIDHGKEGIRACAVCPGPTLTPMFDAYMSASPDPKAESTALLAKQLHGRFIEPQEIASAIWYLASAEAGSVVGTALVVDGGYVTH